MSEDFYEHMLKEKELLKMGTEESIRQKKERKMKKSYTIIYTKTFYCDGSEDEFDQHPRVHYTFDNLLTGGSTDKKKFEERGYVVCEYCYRKFKYEEKKDNTTLVNDVLKGSG